MGIPDCFQGISLIHLVFIRLCCICSHEHLPRLHFLYYNTFTLRLYYNICREICNIHSLSFRFQECRRIYRLCFSRFKLIHTYCKSERTFSQENPLHIVSPFVYSMLIIWVVFCHISIFQSKCKILSKKWWCIVFSHTSSLLFASLCYF